MKHKILKIAYFVTAFVLAGAILLNGVTVPVLAAVEVESLPRSDIDVEVTYDSTNLYLNYEDNLYSITRRQELYKSYDKYRDFWIYGYDTDGEILYTYLKNYLDKAPQYTDLVNSTLPAPVSFWFSPSENRVYSFTGTVIDGVEYGKVKSMYSSSFIFDKYQGYCALNYWDLSDSSFHVLGLIAMYGGDDDYLGIYPVMYVNGTGGINTYRNESGSNVLFPNDMICIYSSYEISGFYEADVNAGTVYTPNYYFQYQYLFYVEDVGYTFIDSAKPLVDIIDNSDTYVYLDFTDVCNRRVWTSVDGFSWAYVNLASGMYGDWQQVPYKWFFDNVGGSMIAKLVYTTDSGYGQEPIITPEFYEDFSTSEVFDMEQIIYLLDYFHVNDTEYVPGPNEDWFQVFVYAVQALKTGSVGSFYDYYLSIQDNAIFKEFYSFIEMETIMKSLSEDYVYEYTFFDDGSYKTTHKISIYNLLKMCVRSLVNIDTELNDMQLNLHNDLKSVFDNISLTNTYMESIDVAIADLPDYTKQFNESIGVQKDILEALEKIEIDVGSSDSVIAIDIDKTYLDSWLSELDSSIDNVAGLVVMDEMTDVFDTVVDSSGNTVGTLSTFLDDVVKDENTLMQLDEVGVYVSSAMSSITKLKVLDSAFTYAGGLSNGIGFINAYADSFYNASGNYAPVFIVGSAMVCVNMFVRRRE